MRKEIYMRRFFLVQLPVLMLAMPVFAQSNGNSSSAASTGAFNQVKTANGIVEGNIEKDGILCFKGIPFAAPPVGELRWKEPQPVKNWAGVRQTKKFGPSPMQYAVFGDMNFSGDGMSED